MNEGNMALIIMQLCERSSDDNFFLARPAEKCEPPLLGCI